jgi:LCP family protein required for cell wall assembly
LGRVIFGGILVIRRRQSEGRARRATVALIVLLTIALTGTASVPLSVAANSGLLSGNRAALLDLALKLAPSPGVIRALEGGEAISYGRDNRLTFLLLGSDYRTHKPRAGERTDMIMVITINRTTGKMAAASIPRDMSYIPLPNGTTWSGRINALFQRYISSKGRAGAADEMRKIVAHLLQVEIDYVAVMRFNGFNNMMDELGGVRVTTRPAKDAKLQDGVPVGTLFPTGSNYLLYGNGEKCRGWFRFESYSGQPGYYCHRALMYARTRKGPKNSDFKRQARNADMVIAGILKAKSSGYSSTKISSFVGKAKAQGVEFYSSLPMTVANATELYGVLKKAQTPAAANRIVFRPTTYASNISGTSKYRIKVAAVRSWITKYFKNI